MTAGWGHRDPGDWQTSVQTGQGWPVTCGAVDMTGQTYCDRLVQDTPFLTGPGRLSEQQVDKIILQLNRYYPQILSNEEAEKFRNPKVSLRVRLCDLLGHLQRSGEGHCQEFYRALYMHAQPLHCCLPSRHALGECLLPVRPWPQCLPAQPSPVTTLATHSFQREDELRHTDVSIVSLSP